jgi:hypothetical protein
MVFSMRLLRLDGNYQDYVNRVAKLTLMDAYKSQLEHIQESPKFKREDNRWCPNSFPGYTIITPPMEEDLENRPFYENLLDCQKRLIEEIDGDLIIPVPPESFHLTLSDLIWDSAYRDAIQDPSFEEQLRLKISECFSSCQKSPQPVRWMVLGLMLRTRAIGVLLAPTDESAYEYTKEFRRRVYQNPGVIALGIEQQYHFTAHITLGYFSSTIQESDRERLPELFSQINMEWLDTPQSSLSVQRVELRKFDDMTRYYRESHWPVFEFS